MERWHGSLQSLFQYQHQILWTFLQRDMGKQKASFLQGAAGVMQPAAIEFSVLLLGYGRTKNMLYLCAMAHLTCA